MIFLYNFANSSIEADVLVTLKVSLLGANKPLAKALLMSTKNTHLKHLVDARRTSTNDSCFHGE